jgi:hypothetical protein
MVQVNQDGSKLNGTHQILVYADDVNILGGRIHIMKKNTEALVVASKKIVLKVNAKKIILSFLKIRLEGESLYIRLIIGPLKG